MRSTLEPFDPLDARTAQIPHEIVAGDQTLAGTPGVGSVAVDRHEGNEVGIWEMTAGEMRDIEVDELFVVVDGEARVTLLSDDADAAVIHLHSGSICRLTAGMRTLWDVPDRIRKVYVLGTPDGPGRS